MVHFNDDSLFAKWTLSEQDTSTSRPCVGLRLTFIYKCRAVLYMYGLLIGILLVSLFKKRKNTLFFICISYMCVCYVLVKRKENN